MDRLETYIWIMALFVFAPIKIYYRSIENLNKLCEVRATTMIKFNPTSIVVAPELVQPEATQEDTSFIRKLIG
jgi:hypothetical protein